VSSSLDGIVVSGIISYSRHQTPHKAQLDKIQLRLFIAMLLENEANEGRQAKKWMENIKEDIELRNMQFKDAVVACSCKDTITWRQLISSTSSPKMTDEKKEDRDEGLDPHKNLFGIGYYNALKRELSLIGLIQKILFDPHLPAMTSNACKMLQSKT